jgi:hypothetical protein
MAYYLGKERGEGVIAAWRRYQQYLLQHREGFPQNAFSLATAEWYHDPNDHRCPHDGWLQSLFFSASAAEPKKRPLTLQIRLLGAYHDAYVEFTYPQIFGYTLEGPSSAVLGDWLYDEFRITSKNHLVHEIEWAGSGNATGARWIIEADDVEFRWFPISGGGPLKQ